MSTLRKAANREVRPQTDIVVVSLFACRGLPRDVLCLVLCTLDRVARLTPAIASNAARPRLSPPNSILPDRLDGGFTMTNAQCLCGALKLMLREPSKLVVACHCLACQRRTGSPFSVGAFYAIDTVEISGGATEFVHVGDSGNRVRIYFCPTCGSTIYWKPDALPSVIGVAVGALAAPDFPAPALSIFERSKHHWVQFDGEVEHFQEGAIRKYSPDLTRRPDSR